MKYVLFTGGSNPPHDHVCILERVEKNWYLINPYPYEYKRNLMTKIVKEDIEPFLKKYEHYKISQSTSYTVYPIGSFIIMSCVGMVKLHLGIKNAFIFTPQHLRLYLQGKKITIWHKCLRCLELLKLSTSLYKLKP